MTDVIPAHNILGDVFFVLVIGFLIQLIIIIQHPERKIKFFTKPWIEVLFTVIISIWVWCVMVIYIVMCWKKYHQPENQTFSGVMKAENDGLDFGIHVMTILPNVI